MVPNLTSDLAGQLIDRLGGEEAYFNYTHEQLRAVAQLPERMTSSAMRAKLLNDAAKEQKFICSKSIEALYFRDSGYPTRLLECQDGPVMLYKIGDADFESRHIVGIVGTRHATSYGIEATTRIVRDLSDKLGDLIIISGLAYGIDVAAHKAALDCGVPTVAVTAHPLNTIYPADHRGVAVQMIKAGGALVTEYPTSSIVHRVNFLARNRIVAGLSDVLIVVESDFKGGAMVTAGLAGDYNRDVYAVPGRVVDRYSRGCNSLIARNKAKIFIDADDIIASMGWEPKETEGQQKELPLVNSPEEQAVIEYLVANPGARQPEIMVATGIPIGRLKDIMFNMEIDDKILNTAGGKYMALTT